MSKIEIDYSEIDKLIERMSMRENIIEDTINNVMHEYAPQKIKEGIHKFIPVSGRNWKGKKAAASSTDPFTQLEENLAVTITTKSNYHYLYFPDDGSNTRRHAGQQHFMQRGGDYSKDFIIDQIMNNLISEIEGGK